MNEDGPVVVSGGTGFIGRHLVDELVDRGVPVLVVNRSGRRHPRVKDVVAFDGDRPDDFVREIVEAQPRAVVHAAAVGGAVTEVAEIPAMIAANLTLGTLLMEASSRASTESAVRFVGIGSFWQRPGAEGLGLPSSLYAATKNALEAVGEYFISQRGLDAVWLHLWDVYGPADERRRLLTLLAEASLSGEEIGATAGDQEVSFVHVSDVVSAIMHVLQSANAHGIGAGPWAVRGPQVASLRSTIEQLELDLDAKIPVLWGERPYRDGEVMQPTVSPLPPGWEAAVPLSVGFSELRDACS